MRRFIGLLAGRIKAICKKQGLVIMGMTLKGEGEAPSSVRLEVKGDASAALKGETGTHALLAKSPCRGRHSRNRWFAQVALLPCGEKKEPDSTLIRDSDLQTIAQTSRGPGGQHLNRSATAIRMCHLPSGIKVRVDSQRSQSANRKLARQLIAALLSNREKQRVLKLNIQERNIHHQLERGNPVRTYRLNHKGELESIDEG